MTISINFPKDMSNSLLLNELIPSEVPLHFNNINFYKLNCKESEISRLKIELNNLKSVLEYLPLKTSNKYLNLLLKKTNLESEIKKLEGDASYILFKSIMDYFKNSEIQIPYTYKIPKNNGGIRYISLIHPYGMIKAKEFIAENYHLILNLSNKSSFSIRSPKRRASYIYI